MSERVTLVSRYWDHSSKVVITQKHKEKCPPPQENLRASFGYHKLVRNSGRDCFQKKPLKYLKDERVNGQVAGGVLEHITGLVFLICIVPERSRHLWKTA